jgi:WD40 repeat protein
MVTARVNDFFVSGGTLPLDSASYIERDCDHALLEALLAGKYCYVLNSRQMGKSSLSVRTTAKLEAVGWCAVTIDLTQMGGRNVTPDQWYIGIAAELGRMLGLRSEILRYWRENDSFSPMQRFFGALREVVLAQVEQPIAIFIDEIDATRNLPFESDEFFAGIRECFNRRTRDAAYERLTFCILGVAVPSDLIRNPNTTPFNIGERVYLRDFTLEEMVETLAAPLGPNGKKLVARVHHWTNGHPYLTQSLCAKIAAAAQIQTPEQVDDLVGSELFGPKSRDKNINLADVANRALNAGANESDPEKFRADLLSTYERIWRGRSVPDDEANRVASLLKLSGLVRSDGRQLTVRNRIYAHVFDRTWIRENMPGQELLRLKQSFRRGLIRATVVYAVVLATVTAFGILAWKSQRAAEIAKEALDRELYFADMTNLRVFEQNGDIARISEVLRRTRQSPYRGFEWGYWQSRLHDAKEEYSVDYFAPGKRETGLLSWDGRLVCVIDDITTTATVLDRTAKKRIFSRRLRPSEIVADGEHGFFLVDTASSPLTVQDLVTEAAVSRLDAKVTGVASLYVRPGSGFLATRSRLVSGKDGSTLDLWELRTGRHLIGFKTDDVRADIPPLFSRDGRRLLLVKLVGSGPSDDAKPQPAWIYDTAQGKPIDKFDIPSGGSVFAMSDSGRYVVYGDGGAGVYGRDVESHQIVYRRTWPTGEAPTSVCFTGGDQIVGTLDRTGSASIEQFPGGQPLGTRHNVWTLAGSPTRPEFVGSAISVRIFDALADTSAPIAADGDRIGRDGLGHIVVFRGPKGLLRLDGSSLKTVSISPRPKGFGSYTYNGRWQIIADPDRRRAYASDTFAGSKPIPLPFPPTNFSGGISREFIAAYTAGERVVFGISGRTGAVLWEYALPERGRALWVSPDGKSVFTFVGEQSVHVLDAATGQLRGKLERHNLRINNMTFSADGKSFFTCGGDGRAILWDLATLTEKMEFQGNAAQRIGNADLSPDGRRVVTSNDAGAWQLWDAATGVQLAEVKASSRAVRTVMFTSDGNRIVAACDDRTVRVWESIAKDPSVRIPVSASGLRNVRQ